jgi:hypothetical protein
MPIPFLDVIRAICTETLDLGFMPTRKLTANLSQRGQSSSEFIQASDVPLDPAFACRPVSPGVSAA